jgi:hypothetical protein
MLWVDWAWFPANQTWHSLDRVYPDGPFYPQSYDLLLVIPIAFLLIIVRLIVERLSEFVALLMGLRCVRCSGNILPNAILERQFKINQRPDSQIIKSLVSETGLEFRDVERWFRKRRNRYKASGLKKFRESTWKFVYYLSIWIFGLYALYDKPWLWWPAYSWVDFPQQHISLAIRAYYLVQLSFYISSAITFFFDVARKDARELLLHHFITSALLSLSWVNNAVRTGTLVLVSHDISDVLLELGKLGLYARRESLTTIIFPFFLVVWTATRLVYFPLAVIGTTFFEGRRVSVFYPAGYVYMVFLWALFGLHLMWSYFIVKILFVKLRSGQMEDVRSDSEPDTDEDAVITPSKADTNINGSDSTQEAIGTLVNGNK